MNAMTEHRTSEAALARNAGRSIPEGRQIAALLLGLGLVTMTAGSAAGYALLSLILGALCIAAAVWVQRFFRDFQPRPTAPASCVVAPAHGVIDVIETCAAPRGLAGSWRRISIYLSLSDVHVQNAPITGEVLECVHVPGKLSRAIDPGCGMRNEHLWMLFQNSEIPARQVALRLISGIWIRRIVPWVQQGSTVERSERVSLIRFGSRTDVFVPAECELLAELGQKVVGGETPLARWIT